MPVPQTQLLRCFFRFSLVFSLNRFVDLLPVDRNFGWGFDTEPNFIAANIHDGDFNVVADENAFIALS